MRTLPRRGNFDRLARRRSILPPRRPAWQHRAVAIRTKEDGMSYDLAPHGSDHPRGLSRGHGTPSWPQTRRKKGRQRENRPADSLQLRSETVRIVGYCGPNTWRSCAGIVRLKRERPFRGDLASNRAGPAIEPGGYRQAPRPLQYRFLFACLQHTWH